MTFHANDNITAIDTARPILLPLEVVELSSESLVVFSGSGPSIFALSKGNTIAKKAGEEMRKAFLSLDINSKVYIFATQDIRNIFFIVLEDTFTLQ